jgi:hypothetical protein
MTVWGTQSVQLVWFTTRQPNQTIVEDTFSALVEGTKPSAVQVNQLPAGGSLIGAVGKFQKYQVRVQMQQGRLDFFVNPQPDPQSLMDLSRLLACPHDFDPVTERCDDQYLDGLRKHRPTDDDAWLQFTPVHLTSQ